MLFTTKGIVLHAIKYGETSVIAEIYTETHGMLGFIVSGVRKPQSKMSASAVQPLSLIELVAYENPKGLCRIKEMRLQYVYQDVPFNIIKSGIGLFMAEIIRRTIKEKEENATLFSFLYNHFYQLDTVKKQCANIPVFFLLELSQYLGFYPQKEGSNAGDVFNLSEGRFTDAQRCNSDCLSSEDSFVWQKILNIKDENFKILGEERRIVLDNLLRYYKYHIDNFPEINSVRILRELWQ